MAFRRPLRPEEAGDGSTTGLLQTVMNSRFGHIGQRTEPSDQDPRQ